MGLAAEGSSRLLGVESVGGASGSAGTSVQYSKAPGGVRPVVPPQQVTHQVWFYRNGSSR